MNCALLAFDMVQFFPGFFFFFGLATTMELWTWIWVVGVSKYVCVLCPGESFCTAKVSLNFVLLTFVHFVFSMYSTEDPRVAWLC